MSPEQFATFMAAFGQNLVTGISTEMAKANPRKVSIGQFDGQMPAQEGKSKNQKLKLKRACYQNGTRLNPITLFNREIDALNKLVRSGRYLNRLIEVVVHQDGSEEVVELRYKNRTIDDRMEHKGAYRDLSDMLTKILAEQDEKLAEEGFIKEQRKAFNSKATQEARARVAAQQQPIDEDE